MPAAEVPAPPETTAGAGTTAAAVATGAEMGAAAALAASGFEACAAGADAASAVVSDMNEKAVGAASAAAPDSDLAIASLAADADVAAVSAPSDDGARKSKADVLPAAAEIMTRRTLTEQHFRQINQQTLTQCRVASESKL